MLYNPEVLLWEKLWLENNKNLDKELYGIVKWINKDLQFGLNVWNRNHFSPIRKAQWPWHETLDYSDWVKPITYQHQAGSIYAKEINHWSKNVLEEPSDNLIDGFTDSFRSAQMIGVNLYLQALTLIIMFLANVKMLLMV